MRPAVTTLAQDIRATLVRILAYMGGLAALAIVGRTLFEMTPTAAMLAPAPHPAWVTVERPRPAFELTWPELSGVPHHYAILRRPDDGARKDELTWGDAAADAPYAVVEIMRPGSGAAFLDAASEVAARIIAFAVTDDVKPAGDIDTKFGTAPMIDFAIAQDDHEHRCLGFARAFETPAIQFAGWYCSAGREVVARSAVGCALDRLTILSAGGDPALDKMFANAELKRTFCGQRSPILAATPERETTIVAQRSAKLSRLEPARPYCATLARSTRIELAMAWRHGLAFGHGLASCLAPSPQRPQAKPTSRRFFARYAEISLASASPIGAPKALIILATSASQPAALRNGEFIWI